MHMLCIKLYNTIYIYIQYIDELVNISEMVWYLISSNDNHDMVLTSNDK